MLYKYQELHIDPADPFKNDELKRLPNAKILTNLISTIRQPFVVSINTPWGTGNTTFLKMWKVFLENQMRNPCIYFNAWENDFSDIPLLTILAAFDEFINSLDPDQDMRAALIEAVNMGKTAFSRTMPISDKIDCTRSLEDENFVPALVDEFLHNYARTRESIQAFRQAMQELVDKVTQQEGRRGPFYFFIDDLDRCRPRYAMELLEILKRIFSIDGLVFVVTVDREQFRNTIQAFHGQGVDADVHLKRFVDLEYTLPKADRGDYINFLFSRRYFFGDVFSRRSGGDREQLYFLKIFTRLAKFFNLTLKEIERCFVKLNIILINHPQDVPIFEAYICFLVILQEKNPEIFAKLNERQIKLSNVIKDLEEIHYNLFSDYLHRFDMETINHAMEQWMEETSFRQTVIQYNEKFKNKTPGDTDYKLWKFVTMKLDGLQQFQTQHDRSVHSFLLDLIRISERFA